MTSYITGKTFECKDHLKAMGLKWNKDLGCWSGEVNEALPVGAKVAGEGESLRLEVAAYRHLSGPGSSARQTAVMAEMRASALARAERILSALGKGSAEQQAAVIAAISADLSQGAKLAFAAEQAGI